MIKDLQLFRVALTLLKEPKAVEISRRHNKIDPMYRYHLIIKQ